ncbi:hypothetical protein [Planococcus rifietoensis]|uniref:hypothetical protein n=1 Tax=Planococcus rifietoensis TaxID=200991 RepID=UPI003850B4CD
MTFEELFNELKATGLPVAYSHFTESPTTPVPKPPFVTYIDASSTNFSADNRTYMKARNIDIELYTKYKDLAIEEKIENMLDENEMPYSYTETWIESEKVFQKLYEVRMI